MDPVSIPLAQLFIWEEPGSPDIRIGNREAAEAFKRSFSGAGIEYLPPYSLVQGERPFAKGWDHESVIACGASSSPVRVRISGRNAASVWGSMIAPLAITHRPALANVDLFEDADGSVSIWQGSRRIDDFSGDTGSFKNPGGDIRFVLPQLWFGDRVCGILHACGMRWHGKTFALIGKSGAGKSTLAAHLAARGAQYVSDDQLFLLDNGSVPRLRVPPSIKSGAWELVGSDFPGLMNAPSFRKDEVQFRLLPDAPFIVDEESISPQHVFFLGFKPGWALALDSMDLDEAFLRLSSIGLWVRNGRLAQVADMLRSAEWHWLRHGDSAAAAEAIAGTLAP